jgi:aerobic-type carbon monoxide dehydrogenase small subunit (CoxS/CutS family)
VKLDAIPASTVRLAAEIYLRHAYPGASRWRAPVPDLSGVASNGMLHPVQQAFLDEGAFQCAFCTSGMIVAAIALLDRKPDPTEQEIRDGMNANICRCCVQPQIVKAVRRASVLMEQGGVR